MLLEKANYTLRIDATGSVVEPLKCSNKRIFLYSIIAHIPECKKILPIADAILCNHTSFEIASFLHFLKDKCQAHKLRWPLCKRVVTDCSYAIINAILAEFNGMANIHQYLVKCKQVLNGNAAQQIDFVTIQFCTSHYTKIICKDIDEQVSLNNVKLREFLREAMGLAFNFTSLNECKQWFEMLSTILSGRFLNENVGKAEGEFIRFVKTPIEEYIFDENIGKKYLEEIVENTLEEISSASPFTKEFQDILTRVQSLEIYDEDGQPNPYYHPKILNFILKKYIAFLPCWTNIIGCFI